jgi:1,4-alpha-glucan branching enzyme/maltooligosyltrehalose trehalohydrolase
MTLTFGPALHQHGTTFRLWAPLQERMVLQVEGMPDRDMERGKDGWFTAEVAGAGAGNRYRFRLPDGLQVPDPASRYQPDDSHGPSEIVDPSGYKWSCEDWTGRPWEEIVLYELHVGTFTEAGSFAAIIERLDHLKALGVTALQIMPISDFPGRYNWGYDGVLPYAPDSSYGHPHDLMALIDAAHERGICVFLDVVYNHFGPDGNYMASYAPLFTEHHKTAWGQGVNFDGDGSREIREFIIQNALYWIREFRFDGLRLDAVHAIKDDSAEHLLEELARRVREAAPGRHVHLVVENEENDSGLLARDEAGRPRFFTAQWNDDVHHVLHIAATGETFGYYGDYAGDPAILGRALSEGFAFQGEVMPYRGETRGKPSAHLPPTAFIAFIQNHDQIGNRAHGDRMVTYAAPQKLKAIAALYLLLPQIPMLFMGEEWGAREPFPYFCDFNEELNQAVRDGRRKELSRLPGFDVDDLLDPTAPSTFASAKLDWQKLGEDDASEWLELYRGLLTLRRERIVPLLRGSGGAAGTVRDAGEAIAIDWTLTDGATLSLLANLRDEAGPDVSLRPGEEPLFALGAAPGKPMPAWSVFWSLRPANG